MILCDFYNVHVTTSKFYLYFKLKNTAKIFCKLKDKSIFNKTLNQFLFRIEMQCLSKTLVLHVISKMYLLLTFIA